ncbi:hypothetical protein K491DRAFT_722450 [Lophiostoma macrostomum CBS 122681]|uniref:Uncharacterized protein n=1 Tax=Lophiostoma macrostomum CBS 122681 TaxID=1314788 RepID=A0A6A6SR15_9PLEO|nr:hypothetical protein K491DRAFT_722450 [Lophiostoma macrostomum CBS 122681]
MHAPLLPHLTLASLLLLSLIPHTSASSNSTLYLATCPYPTQPTQPGYPPPIPKFTLYQAAAYFSSPPSPPSSPAAPLTNATGVALLAYPFAIIEGRNWTTHIATSPNISVTVAIMGEDQSGKLQLGDYAGTASVGGDALKCYRKDDRVAVRQDQGVWDGTCDSYYECRGAATA